MFDKEILRLLTRIEDIKKRLASLGEMRPGSLSRQYNVCGNPTCRCKDPENPKKHGPYYQVSYSHKGKSTTQFVKIDALAETKKQLKNYQTFKRLTEEWVELSVEIAKLRKKAEKQNSKKESS
ncbi:MAG: hypothetical protein JXR76_10615 [Deltaproteobacteria bacterium]|nr:hypothetical protein [Deltaproteobacteria bacterium]